MVGMTANEVGGLGGFVIDVIGDIGAVGVGLLLALETVLPPIPSEIILPFAGFSASRCDIGLLAAWVAATLGALAGALVLYGVGAAIGYERAYDLAGKRWFVLFSQRDLERGRRLFERYGSVVVLFGRCVPLVRSIVSVPAGIVRMPLWRFCGLTLLGSGVWNALFIGAGYALGSRWDVVGQYVQPVSYAVAAALAVGLVVLVWRRYRTPRGA